MDSNATPRALWIDRFVAAATALGDDSDCEYLRLLGEHLWERLQVMAPEEVAHALHGRQQTGLGGVPKAANEPGTTFGDL